MSKKIKPLLKAKQVVELDPEVKKPPPDVRNTSAQVALHKSIFNNRLNRSHDKFQQLHSDSGLFGSFEFDLQNNQFGWSPGLFLLFSLDPVADSAPDLDSFMNFIHQDDKDLFLEQFQNGRLERLPFEVVFRINDKLGNEKFLQYFSETKYDDNLQTLKMSGIIKDITSLKIKFEQLTESEEKYRSIYENNPEAILFTSPDGGIYSANQAACRMFGRIEEEICTVGSAGLADIDDPRLEYLIAARERLGYASGQAGLLKKDGTKFDGMVSSTVFEDSNGQKRTSMMIQDISDRKTAEEKLKLSESRFSAIFNSAPIGIALTKAETNCFVDVNPYFQQITGLKPEEAIGKTADELNFWEDINQRHDLILTAQKLGMSKSETRIRNKDGNIHEVLISLEKLDIGSESYLLTTAMDITERKLAERKMQHMQDLMQYVIEHNRSAVAVFDNDMNYIYVSQKYINDFKIEDKNIIGKNHYNFFPDLPLKLVDIHKRVLSGEVISSDRDPFQREDGAVYWNTWECRPWYEMDGSIGGLILYNEVINEQIESEEKLRESEKLFSDMFYKSPTAIAITTPYEGRFVDVNETLLERLEFSREEIIGKTTVDLGLFIDLSERSFLNEKIRQTGFLDNLEMRFRSKSGKIIHCLMSVALIKIRGVDYQLSTIIDITDRKKAEKAAEDARAFSENLILTANVIIVGLDVAGNITLFNLAAEEITGYTQAELVGKDWFEVLVPKENYPEVWKEFSRLTQLESLPKKFEYPIITKSGDERYIAWQNSVLHDDGNIVGTISFGIDITERRRAEDSLILKHSELERTTRELESSRNMLKLVLESIPVRVFWKDRDSRYLGCNALFAKDAGFTDPLDLIGKDDLSMAWKNQSEIYRSDDKDVMESKLKKLNIIEPQTTPNGESIWLSTSKVPLFNQEGEVFGVLGVYEDITDRKKAEEELAKINQRLVQLIHTVKELASAQNMETVERIVIQSARQLINADGATIIFKDKDMCFYSNEDAISPLWQGKRFPIHECISGWVMENNQTVVIPDVYKDSRVPFDLYKPTFVKSLLMVPVNTVEPLGAIGNYWQNEYRPNDIEVRLMETLADAASRAIENIKLNAQLEERIKDRTSQLMIINKELEAFTYSVSHDLRAPLRAIDGFTKILIDDHSAYLNPEALRISNVIRENTHKMGELINDLLTLSKINRTDLSKSEIDMKTMANSIFYEITEDYLLDRIDFKVDNLPNAYGDTNLMRQVWINLLSNAVKFSSKQSAPGIFVGHEANDQCNIFYIRDNGVGFDDTYKSKLFGVFQRLHTEREFPGTGVGLAIVQRIITKHGGEVWAESELGSGATFYFSLPKMSLNK